MIIKDFISLIGTNYLTRVYDGLNKAEAEGSIIIRKKHDNFVPNYNRKDLEAVCRNMGFNPLQTELILDKCDFSNNKEWVLTRSFFTDEAEKFKTRILENKICKACANCTYLVGKTMKKQDSRIHPYCTFYRKYMYKMSIEKNGKQTAPNIYKDRCSSFSKSDYVFMKGKENYNSILLSITSLSSEE